MQLLYFSILQWLHILHLDRVIIQLPRYDISLNATHTCAFVINAACNLNICFHPAGLASVVKSPTNQTTCFGVSSSFDCIINVSSTINWLINDQDVGVWIATPPVTMQVSPGPGAKSTLTLPGSLLFSRASVVCSYGQTYSIPAFLTVLGMSIL